MKKSLFFLLILFILLTTYIPNFNFNQNFNLNIKKIIVENNIILNSDEIKKKFSFLYKKNLFLLKKVDVENSLQTKTFIESISVKKIYPNKLKLIIFEKKPIAILQKKKKKFYISDKGDLILFRDIGVYRNLPIIYGNKEAFNLFYQDLKNVNFPIKTIKSFYLFESGRWDLLIRNDKVIKLPVKDYLFSLKSFIELRNNNNFDNYKIFDYRIKDQLILN